MFVLINKISVKKSTIQFLPFFIAPLRQAQRDNEVRDRKFDYPLTNDAKISKLATLRQLKFLRLLIVVGPSLHFLRDREDFEIAIAYFNEARFSFRIHNPKSIIFSGLGIVGFCERTETLDFCWKLRRRSPTKSANSGVNKIKRFGAKSSVIPKIAL